MFLVLLLLLQQSIVQPLSLQTKNVHLQVARLFEIKLRFYRSPHTDLKVLLLLLHGCLIFKTKICISTRTHSDLLQMCLLSNHLLLQHKEKINIIKLTVSSTRLRIFKQELNDLN